MLMERIDKIKQNLPIILIAITAILGGCKDDVFNPEKVKATYENKFPVKDVDPLQNWKTTRQVSVDISVYEDYGIDYTIEIFDNNPFDTNATAHLLGQGISNQDMAFRTIIDCPTALSTLYVTRVDAVGRRLMKPVFITNDNLTTSFGSQSNTRVATNNSEVYLQTMARPYTDQEIAALLTTAIEYTGQKMDTNFTNQTVFKITGEYKGDIDYSGALTPNTKTLKLIIAPGATWKMSSNQVINQGLEIIVASNGKIELKSGNQWNPSLKFTNTSSLVVLGSTYKEDEGDAIEDNRGKILGNGWIEFSNGGTNYSAGDIDIEGINNNGGTFFNFGKIDVNNLIGSSTGSLYVNHGDIEADKIGSDESTGPQLENSCKIDVKTHLTSMGIKMGAGACIKCQHLNAYEYIDLDTNSMIEVKENTKFFNCNITGPTTSKSYALLKLKRISAAIWTGIWGKECEKGYLINNIYCEYKEENSEWNFVNGYLNGNAGSSGLKGNGNATLCRPGEAPAYIPADRCTGEGNTPNEGGSDISKNPTTYTYVFEDNFPLVGDYDFNDVVLDVTIQYNHENNSNNIKSTQIKVTLAALGATKTLGAGLRIIGIEKSAISSIKYGGSGVKRFPATLPGSMFGTGIEEGNKYLTIPLFGNAHAVFDNVAAGTMINTGRDVVSKTYTYEIILEQTEKNSSTPIITKENLDFFIAYKFKTMQKRVEVHLFEFRQYGATAAGTVQEANLELAENNTWAICVPNFRYPKESINICDEKDLNNCAYPKFLEWTRDRTVSKDWYKYPNESAVYR